MPRPGNPHRNAYGDEFAHREDKQVIMDALKNSTGGNFCAKCGAWRGELGHEPTIGLFVEHMVLICHEIRRVLRPDGVFWLNIGDTHAGGGRGAGMKDGDWNKKQESNAGSLSVGKFPMQGGLKAADLCGIPWRLALALQDDGWWLRMDCIWHKRNPMPESVNGWRWQRHRVKVGSVAGGCKQMTHTGSYSVVDGGTALPIWTDCPGCPKCERHGGFVMRRGAWRPTKGHEYVFMLTRSERYFCDAEAVRVPLVTKEKRTQRIIYAGKSEHTSTFLPPNRAGRNLGGEIECIEAIEAAGYLEGFCLGNTLKYLWRWHEKGGEEDLKKAQWYLRYYIEHLAAMKPGQWRSAVRVQFRVGDIVHDDLTGKPVQIIGMEWQEGRRPGENVSAVGCVGYWVDDEHLGGGRHPWELSPPKEQHDGRASGGAEGRLRAGGVQPVQDGEPVEPAGGAAGTPGG